MTLTSADVWSGEYVRDRFGVRITTSRDSTLPVEALVGLALRRNPRRAHLLVSTVLAKHVPTRSAIVEAAGALLGVLVADRLVGVEEPRAAVAAEFLRLHATAHGGLGDEHPDAAWISTADALLVELAALAVSRPELVVLGFAETATGLGRLVADQLGAFYLHSTRRQVAGRIAATGFEEEHSHATGHRLTPTDPAWLEPAGTLVLVDDEFSTGKTAINTIRAVHALVPQTRYVVAGLIDLRDDADRARFDDLADELGCAIDVVALGEGRIELPADFAHAASAHLAALDAARSPGAAADASTAPGSLATVRAVTVAARLPSDRDGTTFAERTAGADAAAAALAEAIHGDDARGVLVLGTEEFLRFPLLVARHLGFSSFSSTTRSPIAAVDDPGYAIRSVVGFDSYDETIDGPGPRFAYNVVDRQHRAHRIVVVPEPNTPLSALDGPGGLVEALRPHCDEVVVATLRDPL